MNFPPGVDEKMVISHRSEKPLERFVSQGRTFKSRDWYIEPLLWEPNGPTKFRDSDLAKPVTQTLPKSMRMLATVDDECPPDYYVIVGMGAAAVVNHTTLRQSKAGWDRVGDRPIVHVGFVDPWRHYRNHDMGQIANLLHIPGYEKTPPAPATDKSDDPSHPVNQPRRATDFANDTQHELERVAKVYPFGVVPAWVALIQDRNKTLPVDPELKDLKADLGAAWTKAETLLKLDFPADYPPYRLLLIDGGGVPRLLYARKIDLCTGNGRPRLSIPKRTDALRTYGAKPWEPPDSWKGDFKRRTVLSGLEALCQQTDWDTNQQVCVMGSGGVGVNMVEIGEETAGVQVDWLASGTSHLDSFFNPRNDPLLKGWVIPKDPLKPDDEKGNLLLKGKETVALGLEKFTDRTNVNALLIPASERWRFMQRVYIDDAPGLAQGVLGKVKVALKLDRFPDKDVREDSVKTLPTLGIDSAGNLVKLDSTGAFPFVTTGKAPSYDRVILCSGQNPNISGQPAFLTKLLTQKGPILGPDDRLVGLEFNGGDVRILGAAVTAAGDWVKAFTDAKKPYDKLLDFAATIPPQAGSKVNTALFALNTLNVAYANRWFTDTAPNYFVNLMTEGELAKRLGNKADWAKAICVARAASTSGFRDLADLVKRTWNGTAPNGALDALKNISFSYSAPKK